VNASIRRPKTKILVDGGDPQETVRVKNLIGLVDGQTTNPTLIAKNPEVRSEIASVHKFTSREELDEYKKIVQTIAPLVGDAGVSIEVFSDFGTTAEEMFAQGKEMFSWVPNAYVRYPCTHEGLRAAQMSVDQAIRVNITLCFSQAQAAAVYAATKRSKEPVYVSPLFTRSMPFSPRSSNRPKSEPRWITEEIILLELAKPYRKPFIAARSSTSPDIVGNPAGRSGPTVRHERNDCRDAIAKLPATFRKSLPCLLR
jgi:transaldolase